MNNIIKRAMKKTTTPEEAVEIVGEWAADCVDELEGAILKMAAYLYRVDPRNTMLQHELSVRYSIIEHFEKAYEERCRVEETV